MKQTVLTTLMASLVAVPQAFAAGGEVVQCTGLESLHTVVEPIKETTRTYSNGNIRIWHIDTGGEPVCCSSHLVIIAPEPREEVSPSQCVRLSDKGSLGFQWIDFKAISSSYDPAKGLLLSVPIVRYNDGNEGLKDTIDVRINQATGVIAIE